MMSSPLAGKTGSGAKRHVPTSRSERLSG